MPANEPRPIETIVTIRSDGSATVSEFYRVKDVFEARLNGLEVFKEPGIAAVVAEDLLEIFVVPENVGRLSAQKDDARHRTDSFEYLRVVEKAQ